MTTAPSTVKMNRQRRHESICVGNDFSLLNSLIATPRMLRWKVWRGKFIIRVSIIALSSLAGKEHSFPPFSSTVPPESHAAFATGSARAALPNRLQAEFSSSLNVAPCRQIYRFHLVDFQLGLSPPPRAQTMMILIAECTIPDGRCERFC